MLNVISVRISITVIVTIMIMKYVPINNDISLVRDFIS